MKTFVRAAAAFLAVLILLSVGACGEIPANPSGEEASTTEAEQPRIFLTEEYRVIRGENATDEEVEVAKYVRQSIQEMFGYVLEIRDDFYKDESEIYPYEILVGSTNRPETTQAKLEINGSGFALAIINGKIVLTATNPASLEEGADYLLDEVLRDPAGILPDFCATCQANVPVSFTSLNGVPVTDYVIAAESKSTYTLPIYTLNRYLSKYCGIQLEAKTLSSAKGHKIIIGGTKADGTAYDTFEIGVWFKDGDLHFGCANATMAQQALYTFFAKYLNTAEVGDVTLPDDGTPVITSTQPDNWDEANPQFLTIQDRIVRGCYKLECILEYDTANGKPYTYQNEGYPATIAKARETNNRTTNCVIVGNWVLKDAGFYSDGIYNHTYDGTVGWTTTKNSTCKSWFAENMIVTRVYEEHKYVDRLTKEGRILPGDIIGFQDHNQTILPNGYAFDGGRFSSNMKRAERGGEFRRWVGPNPCSSGQTVGYIARAKDAD